MKSLERKILLFSSLSAISVPIVAASPFDMIENAFQYFFQWMQSWPIMFGLTFLFLMVLFYGIFAAGISRAKAFGDEGKPNRYGKMVALSLSIISSIGILFVLGSSPSESVARILGSMGTLGAIAFALLVFGISYLNFKNDHKTWPLVFFTTGLGMLVYGLLVDSQDWFSLGWLFVLIGIMWFILAGNKGGSSDEGIPADQRGGWERSSNNNNNNNNNNNTRRGDDTAQGDTRTNGEDPENPQTPDNQDNNTNVPDRPEERTGIIRGRVVDAQATLESYEDINVNESAEVLADTSTRGVYGFTANRIVKAKLERNNEEIVSGDIDQYGCFEIRDVPRYTDIIVYVENPRDPSIVWTHKLKPFGRPDDPPRRQRNVNLALHDTEENVIVCANPPGRDVTDLNLPPPPRPRRRRIVPPTFDPNQVVVNVPPEKPDGLDDVRPYTPKFKDIDKNKITRVDLSRWFLDIEDQGHLGACTSYSTGSIYEYINNIKKNNLDYASRLSKIFLYYNVRSNKNDVTQGSQRLRNLEQLKNNGCCKDLLWPENRKIAIATQEPSDTAKKDAPNHKIKDYRRVDPSNTEDWKRALCDGNPLLFGMYVGREFMAHRGPEVFEHKIFTSTPGLHAMVMVGYDSHRKLNDGSFGGAFKIRNSWGLGWGNYGYTWIREDVLQAHLSPFEPPYVVEGITSGGSFSDPNNKNNGKDDNKKVITAEIINNEKILPENEIEKVEKKVNLLDSNKKEYLIELNRKFLGDNVDASKSNEWWDDDIIIKLKMEMLKDFESIENYLEYIRPERREYTKHAIDDLKDLFNKIIIFKAHPNQFTGEEGDRFKEFLKTIQNSHLQERLDRIINNFQKLVEETKEHYSN